MSGISKTIERVKKADPRYDGKFFTLEDKEEFSDIVLQAIMPLITAYEQSQKELEVTNDCLDTIGETHSGLLELYHKTNDELETANKRIAELEQRITHLEIGLL